MDEDNPLLDNLQEIAGSRKLAMEALRQDGRQGGERPSLTDMLVYVLQQRGQARVLYKKEVFPDVLEEEKKEQYFQGEEKDRKLTDFRPPSRESLAPPSSPSHTDS